MGGTIAGILLLINYLRELGFDLINDCREPMSLFLYMGFMEPDSKTVWINTALISMLEHYMRVHRPEDASRRKKLREIVCWHELYHAIEECSAGIYTRNVRIRKRFLGMIPYSRGVEAASEIGAIHFSKLMANVAFSPYIYVKYLLSLQILPTHINAVTDYAKRTDKSLNILPIFPIHRYP